MNKVTDLGKFRHEKNERDLERTNQQIRDAKKRQFNSIDMTVAATIDQLKQSMTPSEAEAAVYQHLSDLVMAYEMQGGAFD